jgi:hypothetical protein
MEILLSYPFIKLTIGVIATFGLYSVLYRETRFFRFFEHIFLGLAAGYTTVALWSETLYSTWYTKMIGSAAEAGQPSMPGYWAWAFLAPIGFMAYFVFSQKHNWMSRVPIGILLGLWSGQQIQVWWNRYGGQIADSLRPVVPTAYDSFLFPGTQGITDPAEVARIQAAVYPTQAINNLIFVVTLLTVMSYFLFSFDLKNRFLIGMTVWGRWLLMIGFGAIFGSTVMTRFALLIDRMYFVWIEWFRDSLLRSLTGGGG